MRASMRAELVRLCARAIRRLARRKSLAETRDWLQSIERLIPSPPRGVEIAAADAGGLAADDIAASRSQTDRRVLYLHGGGYRIGSRKLYRHVTWRIASATRARLVAIDYRLAPEHPFPCALDDAIAAYRWLLANGDDARRIVVMGDSAGGGLTLALLLALRERALPLPGAAVALSPWTDLALTGATLAANAAADPIIDVEELPQFAADYLAGADPRNPFASPLYGDLAGLPPILIQAGSDEVLLDDSVRLAEGLRRANSPVDLHVWPRMFHGWQLFAPLLPESRQAIEQIGAFARRTLDTTAAASRLAR